MLAGHAPSPTRLTSQSCHEKPDLAFQRPLFSYKLNVPNLMINVGRFLPSAKPFLAHTCPAPSLWENIVSIPT